MQWNRAKCSSAKSAKSGIATVFTSANFAHYQTLAYEKTCRTLQPLSATDNRYNPLGLLRE